MRETRKILGITVYDRRITSGGQEERSLKINQDLIDQLKGITSNSGIHVTEKNANTFSAVFAAVRITAESVAMLPLSEFEKDSAGNRRIASESNIHFMIHNKPNAWLTSFAWREMLQAHVELWGNGYSIIRRGVDGKPAELQAISHPTLVTPFMYDYELWYKVEGYNLPFPSRDIIHIKGPGFDGLKGKSVLTVARDTIGGAIAMQDYANKVFRSGASKRTAIKVPGVMNDIVYNRLKKDWENKYSGLDNNQSPALLEGGMELTEIGMDPADAQFIEQRKFSVEEIARFFRIPPHKLQSLDRSTNNNIEHQGIEFVTDTMMPRLARWETELDDKLFSDADRGRRYTKFNVNALMRGDMAGRSTWYKDMIQHGVLSPNEVRNLEDTNPRDGGDAYLTPANLVTDLQREKMELKNPDPNGNSK
jgi:HK97 family phage portal protein